MFGLPPKFLFALLLIVFAFPAEALSEVGDPCPDNLIFRLPLAIDSSEFRIEAINRLRQAFPDVEDKYELFFQDGVISLPGGLSADWASLYFFAKTKSVQFVPNNEFKVAFRATAHGKTEILWSLKPNFSKDLFFELAEPGFLASAISAMTYAETVQFAELLKKNFKIQVRGVSENSPGYFSTSFSKANGELSQSQYMKNMVEAWRFLESTGKFKLELNRFVAYFPWEFEKAQPIFGASIDINSLRTVSKRWLEDGWLFTTCPSFSPPMGKGTVGRELPKPPF